MCPGNHLPIMETRTKLAAIASLAALTLGGCYVVPVTADGRPYYPAPSPTTPSNAVMNPVPTPLILPVRLYPTNDVAAQTGVVSGQVVNHLNGKGEFTIAVGGETLTGEATRVPGAGRQGVANAAGARGSYASCTYTMSSATQGLGQCTFSNGAQYRFHVGS
jgi:hypothetical protein